MIAGRTLPQWFARADELGAAGKYFEAHEELEAAWKAADGETKILLQGLIQLAAGLHRLKQSPEKPGGAFYLLERGLKKLDRTRALVAPESWSELATEIGAIRKAGKAPETFRFGLRAL